MQIVINLSDSVYDAIKNKYTQVNPKEGTLIKTLWDAIEDGIPLPKGHGRLIDADEIDHYMLPSEKQDEKTWFIHSEEYRNAVLHFNHAMRLLKDNAPTIIEADRSEGE